MVYSVCQMVLYGKHASLWYTMYVKWFCVVNVLHCGLSTDYMFRGYGELYIMYNTRPGITICLGQGHFGLGASQIWEGTKAS